VDEPSCHRKKDVQVSKHHPLRRTKESCDVEPFHRLGGINERVLDHLESVSARCPMPKKNEELRVVKNFEDLLGSQPSSDLHK